MPQSSALQRLCGAIGRINFVASVDGMLLVVEVYRALIQEAQVACAKWNHDPRSAVASASSRAEEALPQQLRRRSSRVFLEFDLRR